MCGYNILRKERYGTYVTMKSGLPGSKLNMGMSMVSTGTVNQDKRVVVCSVYVKKGTLNINAKKTNNNFALAAA